MGWWDDIFGGGEEQQTGRQETNQTQVQTRQNYPEADVARQNWGKILTDWGQPGAGYGANLPDYEAIFQNVKRRINQYYWGSPTDPGIIGKIRGSAAQRGVSDSPALESNIAAMGATEGQQIGEQSVAVDTQKAQAIEAARNNWLTSLMNLTNIAPQSMTTTSRGSATTYAPATTAMDALSSIAGPAAQLATSYYTGQGMTDSLKSIFDLANKADMPKSLANPYGNSYADIFNYGGAH